MKSKTSWIQEFPQINLVFFPISPVQAVPSGDGGRRSSGFPLPDFSVGQPEPEFPSLHGGQSVGSDSWFRSRNFETVARFRSKPFSGPEHKGRRHAGLGSPIPDFLCAQDMAGLDGSDRADVRQESLVRKKRDQPERMR